MGLGFVVRVGPIEVVLPTYNGVSYLGSQISSIYQQTLRPKRVLMRDDGSTDGTLELIRHLCDLYGSWLRILPDDGNLGCVSNLNRLLEATTAPYVALADQDDIWVLNKLEITLQRMQVLEKYYGKDVPLLVHTDLSLITETGEPMNISYSRNQRIIPSQTSEHQICLINVVTGCTTLVNRNLLDLALPIPNNALMHDWWLALVANYFGFKDFLSVQTVFYRQHPNNHVGSKGVAFAALLRRFKYLDLFSENDWSAKILLQIHTFEERYQIKTCDLYYLSTLPRLIRLYCFIRLSKNKRPGRQGIIRTLVFYILFLVARIH